MPAAYQIFSVCSLNFVRKVKTGERLTATSIQIATNIKSTADPVKSAGCGNGRQIPSPVRHTNPVFNGDYPAGHRAERSAQLLVMCRALSL